MNTDVRLQRDAINGLSRQVIGCAFEVSNQLGGGFLEKVYEGALCVELRTRRIPFERQVELPVRYKGQAVGTYVADMLVDQCVLVELKCVEAIRSEHVAQCLNYLAAARLRVCLLLNFRRSRLEWRRVVNEF